MLTPKPTEKTQPVGPVVSPETLMEWRRLTARARQQAANLGLVVEFEAEFRLQKKKHNPAEAARRALELVALPKLVEQELTR